MTRPDDIPEWAWEKANKLRLENADAALGLPSWERLNFIIARAILAAVEEERTACALLIEEGFDRAVDDPYRDDGKPSKNDRCAHDRAMYEDCEQCAAAAIRNRS